VAQQLETLQKNLDYVWVLAMAALVFIMQAGFMCLEAGIAQAKHSINYPIFGHWAWGNFLNGDTQGWLEAKGFLDFAGSSVVHSVGGWVALAGIIVIGPRLGKFDEEGNPRTIQPHSMTLAYLGTFILIFGWFGFNCGSTLAATPDIAGIAINTMLAASFGCLCCSLLSWVNSPYKRPEGEMIANGTLGGLVGITAGCAFVSTASSAVIGLIAGAVTYYGIHVIEKVFRLDDAVGAVTVHGICGAWGTLAVGFFITPAKLAELGVSRFDQIWSQCTGVVTCFLWAFGSAFIMLKILNALFGLRVAEEDEIMGLNVAEHGASSSILDLANAMVKVTQADPIDDSLKVDVETGTEAGDLANSFNQMIDAVQTEQSRSQKALQQLQKQRTTANDELRRFHAFLKENVSNVNHETETITNFLQASEQKATQMASAVQQVVASVGCLLTSLSEVSGNTKAATEIVETAVSTSHQGKEVVDHLGESASEIGQVVAEIKDIASKINILALNSNIETARAGEAGRGFKVVANEVMQAVQHISQNNEKSSRELEHLFDVSKGNLATV
jgi:Amt family ammonium transporter